MGVMRAEEVTGVAGVEGSGRCPTAKDLIEKVPTVRARARVACVARRWGAGWGGGGGGGMLTGCGGRLCHCRWR